MVNRYNLFVDIWIVQFGTVRFIDMAVLVTEPTREYMNVRIYRYSAVTGQTEQRRNKMRRVRVVTRLILVMVVMI